LVLAATKSPNTAEGGIPKINRNLLKKWSALADDFRTFDLTAI
jgi:hypothetical protein